MKFIIGKTAGFCFGVKNAVTKTVEELDKNNKVYCLGELVHNKQVTEELTKKGAKFIDNLEEANGKVIIRSHGVTKNIYEKAKELDIELLDLTCPKVLHIHKIAEEYYKKGYYLFIVGKADHPEMIGTISFCGDNYYVIEKEEDTLHAINLFKKSCKENVLVISQTTYSLEKFNNIVNILKENIDHEHLEIRNTICTATKQRQEETMEIAKKVEAMIIVGGKHSSNSNKLYELAKKYCKKVLFVETEKEIDINYIKNAKTIGIMAGASTPEESIQKVVEKLDKIC